MTIFIEKKTIDIYQNRDLSLHHWERNLSDLPKAWIRWLALGVCSLIWGVAHAQNPPMLCIPAATGPAFASGAPDWWSAGQQAGLRWDKPTDPRWLGALSRDYGYGATSQQEFRALTVDEPEPTAQNPLFKRTYLVLSWQFKLAPGWAAAPSVPPRLLVGFSGASGENARLLKTLVSTTNTGLNDDWLPLAIAANQVTFYSNIAATGSTTTWATSTPSWLSSAKTKLHYWANTINNGSDSDRWVIQMKLPLDEAGVSGTGVNGLPIGRSGFKLWFSAVHPAFTLEAVTPTAAANFFTWPDDGSTTFAAVAQTDAPAEDIANWAPARADGNSAGCAGITLSSGDIGTRRGGLDSNQVSVTQPNILFARPVLHAPSTAAASVPPNTLTATFRFANWGSQALGTYTGSSWTAPLSLNPTPPTDTVGMSASSGGTATTTIESTWNLTPEEQCRFTGQTGVIDAAGDHIDPPLNHTCPYVNPIVDLHSCMQVELNGPGQMFLKQSAFRNMNFVQASEVVRSARISVAGLPNVAGGKRDVYMYVQQRNMPVYRPKSSNNESKLIQVTSQQREILSTLARGGSPSGSVDALASIMPTYLIHAYHDTGKDLVTEDGTKIRLLAPQTSFGYFIAHNGELQGWQDKLEGAQPVGPPNLYKVAVPNGGEVKVINRISAIEPGTVPPCKCACNDAGCLLKCNQQASNDSGAISGTLTLVGTLGVGGFAFLRRRRSLFDRAED